MSSAAEYWAERNRMVLEQGLEKADAVARELKRMDLTADQLDADERLGIVAALEPQGIFLLKGAVKEVADALGCSQATVYRYLAQVRKETDIND